MRKVDRKPELVVLKENEEDNSILMTLMKGGKKSVFEILLRQQTGSPTSLPMSEKQLEMMMIYKE